MNNIKFISLSVFGIIGSALAYLLGGWDTALQSLIIFISVDFIAGLLVAAVWNKSNKTESGKIDSRACFKGLIRKGGILLMVLISTRLDKAMNTDGFVRTAVILYFIGNEGLSIVENLGVMGVPLPDWINDKFEQLKNRSENRS